MKILYITQYYPPEPVPLQSDFVRIMRERGHSVTVLTGFPCWPEGRTHPGWRQKIFGQTRDEDGIKVVRVPQFPDHSRSGFRRALYYLSFMAGAATLGLFRSGPCDAVVVYQSAVPTGLAACVVARLRGAGLVFHVVDLWPESVTASGMLQNRAALWMLKKFSAFTYRRADYCAAITKGFLARLREMGVAEKKSGIVRFWAAENAEPGGGNVVLPELPHCAFRVVYAGNVGPVQGLENAVLAAGLLRDDGVELAIAGDGLELSRLKALAAEKGIANVQFTGRLPLEAMPELYARADALLVMLKTDALSRISIPSKLQSYLQSGKPVLAAIAGETAELVVEKGFGVACDPTSPEAVAQAVRSLVRMTGGERLAMGERARAVFREEFCGPVQGVALCELLERSGPSAGERCT